MSKLCIICGDDGDLIELSGSEVICLDCAKEETGIEASDFDELPEILERLSRTDEMLKAMSLLHACIKADLELLIYFTPKEKTIKEINADVYHVTEWRSFSQESGGTLYEALKKIYSRCVGPDGKRSRANDERSAWLG